MSLFRKYILLCLIFTSITCFGEEKSSLTNTTTEKKSELTSLRIKFLKEELTADELFRLASFYLSEKIYGKAAELYGLYIDYNNTELEKLTNIENYQKAHAHYNRALALFAQGIYISSLNEFEKAYVLNPLLHDSLRMSGTIYFIKKDIPTCLEKWKKYLTENTTESKERNAIEQAITILEASGLKEETINLIDKNNDIWPFLNPDHIANPDAKYEKKRVI